MSCRSLIEGITPEIHMLCFVLMNNILSNLLCVWIFSQTVFIQWLQPTHRGVNQHSKDITQTQQQRPESPTVTLTWHARKYKGHKLHRRHTGTTTKT